MSKPAKNKKILFTEIFGTSVLLIAAALLVMYFTVGIRFNKSNNPPIDYNAFDADTVLTAEQVAQDKAELIHNLESTHPYFAIKELDSYEDAKRRFSDAEISTSGDFYFAAAEFLTVFKDLHTRALPIFPVFYFEGGLSVYAEDGKWMVYAKGEDNPASELYAVNGVLFESIKKDMMRYFPQENGNSYALWLDNIFQEEFLRKSGVEFEDTLTFTYKDADGGFFDTEYHRAEYTSNGSNAVDPVKNFEIIPVDSVLRIKVRDFTDDGSFDECMRDIKKAIKDGINRVIIDVRGTTGGSDGYAKEILNALGFKYSSMGFTIRYSEVTAKYRGTWRKSGYETVTRFKYRSENKNSIDLKVFCNEYTASASMAIVNQCVYSELGELIGRTPGQNTNFCGNVMQFQMANSKVAYLLPLSYSFFERGGQKAPDVVMVDVEVPPAADHVDYVVWK